MNSYEELANTIATLTRAVDNLGDSVVNVSSTERVDIEDTMTNLLALIDALAQKGIDALAESTSLN